MKRNKKRKIIFIGLTSVVVIALIYMGLHFRGDVSLNGTYQNVENSFNWISFDSSYETYLDYGIEFEGKLTTSDIAAEGKFYQDVDGIKILNGKYVGYSVEIDKDILILKKNHDVRKYKKISEKPTYVIK